MGEPLLSCDLGGHLTSGQNKGYAHKDINHMELSENPGIPNATTHGVNVFFFIHVWSK